MALRKSQAALNRDLKHRVLTCLNKLSDRDTHSAAASELESIAITLNHETIPPFLSSIAATDAADKSPVRKQCIRIISLLSEAHGDALSPYLSKLLSPVVRRLRDPDSALRSACVHATASISSHITKPPFTSILKPLIDALVTEQDHNSQIGAALCLAAAIDASPDPEPLYLKKLLPRFEKLLKSNSFRAKPALLTLIGSIIDAGAASTDQILKNLVPCLVAFVGSDDWTARKAAAEALVKLAVVEREVLAEFKAACLKTFEAKKFDKVKIVRETMNQLVDAWKKIADVSENASDGQYPPGSKTSCNPQMRKKRIPVNRSALSDGSIATTAKKRSPVDSSDKKSGPAMFRKLDRKKPTDRKIEIVAPHTPVMTKGCEDDPRRRDEEGIENDERLRSKFMNPETRRTLFSKDSDGKMLKFGGVEAGSCVVPCHGDGSESTVAASNITQDMHKNQKEGEDLTLIRKQLVQIEIQQSSVLDLLQKFIGSSENGMHSLETRVQGLELALDEISYDLAVTTGRMSKIDSELTMCCKLPGAELFSPKFWRRAQLSSSRGTPLIAAIRNESNYGGNAETSKLENRRLRVQRSDGFIVNPLAEIHSDSHPTSEVSSNLISNNVRDAL